MKLHQRTIDDLLAALGERQDVAVVAKDRAKRAEFAHERMLKGIYNALRAATKISVEDAKAQAFCADSVELSFNDYMDAEREKDAALYALEEIKSAIDGWRTEQSTLRSVR